ncbi:hypothetical protein QE320_gp035 [Pseudomonas phage EM]|uniref:Uncharacterized protein n=1 Tax=Pseudomonas phage EM TaxID=2936914 RepID=A0AAE9KSQ8_9CAUD|nr:hypothetical protein QE320_gp035 [Pseudomonas phage EM]UPW35837.1 hypothetical protein EM_035 [Pseudomonas phage EM]
MWANNSAPNSYTPVTTREIKEVLVKWEYLVNKAEKDFCVAVERYNRPLTRWEKFKGMDKWSAEALLHYDSRKAYTGKVYYLELKGKLLSDIAWVLDMNSDTYSFHSEAKGKLRELQAMAKCEPGRDHYVSGSILKLIRKIERIYEMEKSLDD